MNLIVNKQIIVSSNFITIRITLFVITEEYMMILQETKVLIKLNTYHYEQETHRKNRRNLLLQA
jgi:hypothetical protein